MNHLINTALFVIIMAGITMLATNEPSNNTLYVCQFMRTDAKECVKSLCANEQVNAIYKKLSWGEQRTIRKFWEKTINLWSKVREQHIDWETFTKEAINILKPCEALAKKFAENDLYIFSIPIGSQYGMRRVLLGNQWPQGFGIIMRTEIQVYHDTPATVEAFITALCKDASFEPYYATLSMDEQEQINDFAQKAITLYGKVNAGLLNHVEFQSEARECMQPYEALAKKIADENDFFPFSMIVAMDFSGQPASLYIGYDYCYDGEFKVICNTRLAGQENA